MAGVISPLHSKSPLRHPTKTKVKGSGQEFPLHISSTSPPHALHLALHILCTHNLVLQAGDGRATGELFQECVADVAEIFDSDFAGEEAVGGELA